VERFLSLCAQDNMTVAMPSTQANYFHLLRWQVLSGRRKPLIVFTPKSMLRLKTATSATADFTGGSFLPVIPDPLTAADPAAAAGVRRVLLCSGKVYYDLAEVRRQSGAADAIVRIERLYPLPAEELTAELARYPQTAEVVWVQEEPANMGAWPRMALKLPQLLGRAIGCVSLPPSSAPAAGSSAKHKGEHRALVEAAVAVPAGGALAGPGSGA
jgi:2-oxoglutarate dehydrogenase E1 component